MSPAMMPVSGLLAVRLLVCLGCGHARDWHLASTGHGCTYELQDEDGTWIRCGCEAFRGMLSVVPSEAFL